MNVKLFTTIRSIFAKKAPQVVETVAQKATPTVAKKPQLKYVPADTVMSYLTPEMKEIAAKYKTMVAFDKAKTYLSYRKNPSVRIRASYSSEGRFIEKDLKFADGRTMHSTGCASKTKSASGTSVLKDKDGTILKENSWQHKIVIRDECYKLDGVIDSIETSTATKIFKDGKLDHGIDIQAKYTKPRGIVFDGMSEVINREKNIVEYSIPAQRKVESTIYQECDGNKVFKGEPKISIYPEKKLKDCVRPGMR